jgi:hypothetical protein
VPVRVVWAYFAATGMGRTRDALDTARGIGLALGGKDGGAALRAAQDDAFPTL